MENSVSNYLKFSNLSSVKAKSPFPELIEDNLIQKIFGGCLISTVNCGGCKNISARHDKFIDISLVIKSTNILLGNKRRR